MQFSECMFFLCVVRFGFYYITKYIYFLRSIFLENYFLNTTRFHAFSCWTTGIRGTTYRFKNSFLFSFIIQFGHSHSFINTNKNRGQFFMKIFTNEIIDINDVDFTKCETLNGDFIDIATTRPNLLEKYISIFERYIQKYPKHANREIWQKYISVFETSLVEHS